MKIVADAHIPYVKAYFESYGDLILKEGRQITAHDVKDADILLVRSITPVTEKLLLHSRVQFVGSVTAGKDHLDTTWLDQARIGWSVASGFNAPPVVDYILSVIAALQMNNLLSSSKAKIAIIGVGKVGELLQQKLSAFNYEVMLCDPIRAKNEKNFSSTPIEAIEKVDLISLHVPLTFKGEHPTFHLIDADFLKRQQANCVLVNTSRGAVVESTALMKIRQQLIYCLDVWENEPHINRSLLENIYIGTPHIAGYSIQSKIRGIDMIYRKLCEKGIITKRNISQVPLPYQTLTFNAKMDWREILLAIFNPLLMTSKLRETLNDAADQGKAYDEMRNQFNYRHEFSYSKIKCPQLATADVQVLKNLSIPIT